MTKVLNWRLADDQRDVVHLAVQALAEGHLVAFPTDTVYQIAANAMRPMAVERLVRIATRQKAMPLEIALRSATEAEDFAPDMSPVAKRLASRSWPGPVALQMRDGHVLGLTTQLSEVCQRAVMNEQGDLTMRVPAHDAIAHVLHLSSGPLLVSTARSAIGRDVTSADEISQEGITLVVDDGPSHFQHRATTVHIQGNQCHISDAGVLDENALSTMTQMVVLFVCTGNTCRSPMAQVLLQDKLHSKFSSYFKESLVPPVAVCSAGISAMTGGSASAEAIQVMADRGLDLHHHQSSPINTRLFERADLVLTMTENHRRAIFERWPKISAKVKTLAPAGQDISDPFGGSLEGYRECAKQIDSCLDMWVDEIDENMLPMWR